MTASSRGLPGVGTFLFLVAGLLACGKPPEEVVPPPRETIAVKYVATPELKVLAGPEESAEVLSVRRTGEAVSIYAEEGEWTEIQMGLGDSGWVSTSALADSKEEVETSVGKPRFRVPATPIFSPANIHGEIVLEASVNTDGKVVEIRTIANTTGSAALEAQNRKSLGNAVFYPLFQNGRAMPFVYEHRVTY